MTLPTDEAILAKQAVIDRIGGELRVEYQRKPDGRHFPVVGPCASLVAALEAAGTAPAHAAVVSIRLRSDEGTLPVWSSNSPTRLERLPGEPPQPFRSPVFSRDELSQVIERAARTYFEGLFEKVSVDDFYACVLMTTADPVWAYPSACCWEGLRVGSPELMWDPLGSRYCEPSAPCFQPVREAFLHRPELDVWDDKAWDDEVDLRLDAMVLALRRLDDAGLFGTGPSRERRLITVELVPPEEINVTLAEALNSARTLEWAQQLGWPLF